MWRAYPELFIAEDFEGLAYREAFSGDMFLATCQQEQVVHIEDRMGFWSMAHQSIKYLKCEKEFEVMVADAIIGCPFLPLKGAG